MVIFSGWKTFVVLAAGGALLALLGDSTAASLVIAAFIVVAGFWVNSPRIAEDGAMYRESNSLFFVPIQWWGIALFIGVLVDAML